MAPPPLRHYASTSALPSRFVTEDTPADLLEGQMDLTVILPAGHNVNMQVHRSTPMMDLLIQVTTAHKINPGGHVIHVVSDNRLLSYKPSTPIGTLDTTVIQIVPKNKVNEARKNRTHLNTQAIEKNIRLKVNLPRNQLAVYRVPPKTQISEVLQLVCKEKGLDIDSYEIRHPVNVDEKLRGVCSLSDYQLQEVTVVPRGYRAPPLSVTDLITMAAISHPEDKKRKGIFSIFSRKNKTSSTGDSSLSSGSAGERSVSPARSDESVEGHPSTDANPRPLSHASSSITLTNGPPPTRPRKRQAPSVPPPATATNPVVNGKADETNHRVEIEKRNGNALSRNSSNSSDQRSSLLSGGDSEYSNSDGHRPTTNLTSVVSTSSLSLASRGKRRAPVPPKPPPPQDQNTRPTAIPEETDSVHSASSQDPKIVEESRVNVNGESAISPPQTQSSPLPTSPSSPSSSSFVSSVSSLSSVEQQASPAAISSSSSSPPVTPQQPADSNSVEPPPPPETEAPSPPPVTDNEVQSRTASFSSESSEESQGSKRTTSNPVQNGPTTIKKILINDTETTNLHTNIPQTAEPITQNEISKQEHILSKQEITTNKNIRERSFSSVSSSSGSSYESTTRKESIVQKDNTNNVLNGLDAVDTINIVTSVNGISNSVKKTSNPKYEDEECDSGTVSDSSQDQEIVNKQSIKPKLEENNVKDKLKIEILEAPLPMTRIPEPDTKIESPGILADDKLVIDKQPSASSGSRKDSVSSMSSVSSYESTNKIEKIKLSAQRSQELSKRDIENQLQEAFANLDGETQEENLNINDVLTKKEISHVVSTNNNTSSNLDYKIPAPPEGFKDGTADDTSSVSSDSTQGGHIKIFSALNDTEPSSLTEAKNPSLTEAKNPALVVETNKVVQLPIPGESEDFNSLDRKNKIITEKKNIVDDSSKQSVINELKNSLKETNNNEPRIVDVKPKIPITTMVVPTKKVIYPTDSQSPRKDSVNSISSYESCGESSELQKALSRDHRSASESSYDSAPPPIPEATYPDDIDAPRASRSSSISSTNSAASSAKTKPPSMNFSISTYTNRAEEISYDKKIVKSESFSHQMRPGKTNLSKAESFTVQTAQYKSEFDNNILTEEKEDVNTVPFQNSEINKHNSNESQVRSSSLGRVSSFNNNVFAKEKDSMEVPIQSIHMNKFITSDSQIRSSSLGRVSSFNEKSNSSKNSSDNFVKPELLRHPRRFQHGETSEPLERTASMVDLSHPQTNLRRAQSDIDVTEDSLKSEEACNKLPSNSTHTLTNTKPSDCNTPSAVAQEQNKTPVINVPDVEQMQKVLGSGIRDPSMVPMMPDSRLAEEFVKLQQDFFRWQQQLLQNQHLLHSRVAPIASNPPSLQSVGVLRDIMSQSTSNLADNRENEKLKSDRLVDVKVEREVEENNSDKYQNRGVRSLSRPWLSQSVQDVSGTTEEPSITTSNRNTYNSQPTRRWGSGEEPNVRVGAWGERSQAVNVQQDKDHYTNTSSRSRSTQDLSTAHNPEGGRRWTPPKTFISPQPFSRSQAENVGYESSKPYQRRQQQHIQPQSNATDQSASEVFWKELQARRAAFGLQEQEAGMEEPQRPPRRTQNHMVNGDSVDSQERETSKPLTYFGQSNGPSEPQSYYYNGKKPSPSALSKVANNAAVSRPRDVESDSSGARYTSVVTLSSDKSGPNQGTSAPKDKVRSVVQLNNTDNRPQIRSNPVVRGFRQPVEEKQGTFQSRIISNSSNSQQGPQQYAYNTTAYQGPTASRLVSAATGAAVRESMTPSGGRSSSPASYSVQNNTTPLTTTTTSAAASATGTASYPSVKLRPVNNTSPRASPPVEIVAPSVARSNTSPPPAAPPAPVAPPPPPAAPPAPLAPLNPGERRTASGKIIKPAKKGPTLDPREELMMAIRNSAGGNHLRKTRGN